eukprot:7402160-Karenia_brevis.AAC.1
MLQGELEEATESSNTSQMYKLLKHMVKPRVQSGRAAMVDDDHNLVCGYHDIRNLFRKHFAKLLGGH